MPIDTACTALMPRSRQIDSAAVLERAAIAMTTSARYPACFSPDAGRAVHVRRVVRQAEIIFGSVIPGCGVKT